MAHRLRTRRRSLSVITRACELVSYYCAPCGAHYPPTHFADGHSTPIG